jgi:hypothetical protein
MLAGCGSPNPEVVTPPHVHVNGLQLSVSGTDFHVTTTPTGFLLEPPNNDQLRTPFSVSIQLLATEPKTVGRRVRYVGKGRILWYTVTREKEGGSGGVDYTVIAFEHVGNRWIQYSQTKQAESTPLEVFEIARGLRYVR